MTMHRFHHLMVALTRTSTDAELIRYAAGAARLSTANEIRFVHVLPSNPATAHDHDQVAAEVQAEVATYFTDVPESVKVCCDVLKGPLTDRLLTHVAEQEADLLFVGHQLGHSGQRSLARRLAMKAPCSVWMVPQAAPHTLSRILVPIDFSDHASDTMRVAVALAHRTGAACLALHVYFNEAAVTYEEYGEVLRGQERQAYEHFIAPLDCQGVEVTPLFVEGANVAHVINRTAEERGADLIVMGTRGRSRSAAILLGSVTEETLIDTHLPLLVVKHFGARLGLLQVLLDRSFRRKKGPHFD